MKTLILLYVLSPSLLLAERPRGPDSSAEKRAPVSENGAAPDAAGDEMPTEIPAISLWVDMGLGLISERAVQQKMNELKVDFKASLQSETDAMTGDLYGVRQVTGKQFAALIDKMDEVSSFYNVSVIGTTATRAYLEAKFFLTSGHSYVAIVITPVDDLPAATRKKLSTPQKSQDETLLRTIPK